MRIVGFRRRSLIPQRKDRCLQCHVILQPSHPGVKSPRTDPVATPHGADNGVSERRARAATSGPKNPNSILTLGGLCIKVSTGWPSRRTWEDGQEQQSQEPA